MKIRKNNKRKSAKKPIKRRRNPPEGSIKPSILSRVPIVGRFFRKTPLSTPWRVADGFVVVDAKDAPKALAASNAVVKALASKVPIYFSPDGKKYFQINIIREPMTPEEEQEEERRAMFERHGIG